MLEDVTAITVCYNTQPLFKLAYESFRKAYPNMQMIIIDNSARTNPCAFYAESLKSEKTKVIPTGRNLGHGPGMHEGLKQTETPFAVIFDSDIELIRGCVGKMRDLMKPETFGIGKIVRVNTHGQNEEQLYPSYRERRENVIKYRNPKALKYYRFYKAPKHPTLIPYLHPFFHLINVANYKKFPPYIHHGAPCIATMYQLFAKRLSNQLLINFPVHNYVRHRGRGTRKTYPLDHRKKKWDWKM